MDTKKIAAIVVAAIVIVAGAAIWIIWDKDDKDTLKVAYLTKGYYPFIVGFDNGMFDDLSFKVEPVIVSGSGQDAVNAVLSRDAHMAATGEAPFVNTLGKHPDDIIGLAQYTQSSGSAAGHRWIAHPDMIGIIPAMTMDSESIPSNSQAVADAIKAASAAGKGKGTDNMVTIGLVNGSTTLTMFMKWCIMHDITYVQGTGTGADVQIKIFEKGSDIAEALGLGQLDIGGGSDPIPDTLLALPANANGQKTYEIGNSSVIKETTFSVLCTTKEYYDKYSEQMIEFLGALKKVNEWMSGNVEDAVSIIAPISGIAENTIRNGLTNQGMKVIWDMDHIESWTLTATINGSSLTKEDFTNSCPHRDIINGWYAET